MRICVFLIVVLSLCSVSCQEEGGGFSGENTMQVLVDIEPGQSFSQLSLNLQKQSLVKYPLFFKVIAKIFKYDKNFRPGQYVISSQFSYLKILDIFKNGPRKKISLTIPEGFNIFQIAKTVEVKNLGKAKRFLQLCSSSTFIDYLFKKYGAEKYTSVTKPLTNGSFDKQIISLEGYLFPDTYYFYKYDTEKNIIEALVKKFFLSYKAIMLNKKIGLNRHEIITLASIVEKETGQAKERPLIAGVFLNRLKKRMRLQTDPTILYGMWVNGSTSNNIRKKDILAYTRYNTYRIKALPIGPIANPGIEAIKAVLLPKKSNFLYFVSKNNGEHIFSKTYAEHAKYVREYQMRRRPSKK